MRERWWWLNKEKRVGFVTGGRASFELDAADKIKLNVPFHAAGREEEADLHSVISLKGNW